MFPDRSSEERVEAMATFFLTKVSDNWANPEAEIEVRDRFSVTHPKGKTLKFCKPWKI